FTEAIHVNMYNYLFKRNESGDIEPDLVAAYENIDETTWQFTLREDVTFHNGDQLTAEDVKFTLERAAKDDSLREHFHYSQIESVDIVDDYEFIIKTYEPEPILLNRLSRIGSGILPKDYIETNGWDHFYKEPIGTGPFKFVKWDRDSQIVYEAYDDYFAGKVEDWDKLVFRIIPETSTRVGELLTGGVDIAVKIPHQEWNRVEENDGTSIVSTDVSQRVAMLLLRNHEGYPTEDQRVREAIDLAIDNEVLTEHVLGGSAVPVRTRVTPGNTGAYEGLYDTYEYDPERAKQLLEEAGYADGLDITIHGTSDARDIVTMIADMLDDVNINVNIDLMEQSKFVELRNERAHEDSFFITYGNSLFDASLALDNITYELSGDFVGYYNEEFEELVELAGKNMDLAERDEQYKRAQEIVAEDRPYVYLYAEKANYGVSDQIDFTPRSDEMLYAKDIKKK
ncbi:MAG TPA: ABC transporter substrate-binding protein, partial [Bacillota bacterium]|nr:ABC transporter substrate-binding protein [Bacillota bacterium]